MELIEFVVKAKLNSYAGSGGIGDRLGNDGSKEFTYREGPYSYRDQYFGFNPFIGEEIIWKDDEPVWGMNFYGRVKHRDLTDAKEIYSFLRKALQQVSRDYPYRGPRTFSEGKWRYSNEPAGGVDNFSGNEKIHYNNQEVYSLNYSGGAINRN